MPKIENCSRFAAVDRPSLDKDGRGLLVVCVCGCFDLPPPGKDAAETVQPSEAQPPPPLEDVYWGEPGKSSLKYEGQSCYHRPGTDISMNGTAWARLGRPTIALPVSLRVGSCQRQMAVIGDRFWRRGALLGANASSPEPFASMPLVYERAFGGAVGGDLWEPRNPVGRGLYRNAKEAVDRPLPNIEDPNHLVRDLKDRPAPIGVGPIARDWEPRRSYAGTYDEKWVKENAPLWPKDFDERFFCAASPGLTSPKHLVGGEPVEIKGVSPDGAFRFTLPQVRLLVKARFRGREDRRLMTLDAVMLEPDAGTFTLTWRAAIPAHRALFDHEVTFIRELEPCASQRSEVRVAAAEVMGYRRQGKPEELAKQLRLLLEQQTARPRPALGKESEPGSESANARVEMGAMGSALARMRYVGAMTLIEKTLAAVANQAIMPDLLSAAATLGSDWALDVARAALRARPDEVDPELYVILALGSEERDAGLFTGLQPKSARHKQALCTAMGILGVPEFIPRLIERLEKEKEDGVRLAAAGALRRITGAGLREIVPAPDDELSDSEPSQEPNPGQAAGGAAPPQKPMVERTSTDPQAWAKWWADHGRSLSARKRLRSGRRFQLIACVEEAAFAGSSQQARALAMRELEMRTPGQDVKCWGYEPDGYVEHQVRTMSSWRAWCIANGYGR